ncbi:hypothetical protein BX600DRAFT_442625 [Xylariales sp. PMI_506]|nr:hypothetical protein BX600DRAFT_442625 [Xylariales sp. PMI_506]
MLWPTVFSAATVAAMASTRGYSGVPHLQVPACPLTSGISYDRSVPDLTPFPETLVSLCYEENSTVVPWSGSLLHINFTARGETNFYYNASQGTNDAIWEYEVMEAFIYRGTADPQTYLEFEVSPNNVTFQAFIYNPSKVRAAGAPFDTFFIVEPSVDGFAAESTLDPTAELWTSEVRIPLGLFNVDPGTAKGTEWRMNFFRTITSPETYPDQELGAWNPPDQASFHMTPYFGKVTFI